MGFKHRFGTVIKLGFHHLRKEGKKERKKETTTDRERESDPTKTGLYES